MSIHRNTIYNLLGSVIPLAISLVTIPIYLDLIGESRYGVLAIAWLLLGYFGIFDLGLGRATAQRIAVLKGAPSKERANVFWTALTLNIGLGIIGGLLIWPATTYFFGSVFKIEDTFHPEMQATVPWLILAVPMATLSGVLVGALQGREHFLELNIISVSGTMLFQLLPLAVAAFWSVDLSILIPAALFARMLTLVVLFLLCQKHIILGYPPYFTRKQARKLIHFGGWIAITAFVGPMMITLDRFVIGALSSAQAVAYYTIPFQLAEKSTIFSSSLASALFPRLAAVSKAEEKRLATEGLSIIVSITTPLTVAGILFIEPFLAWWISQEFANQSTLIGQVLLLGFWFNSFAKIPSVQLQARGRPDIVAKCHLAQILPYLGLLYLGVNLFGAVGAAIVFSLRVIIDFILLASFSGTLHYTLRFVIVPIIMLLLAFFIALNTDLSQQKWFLFVVGHLLLTATLAWLQSPAFLRVTVLKRLKGLLFFPSRS